jgi:hypothetical protein
MSNDISSDEELADILETILRSRKARRLLGQGERYYLPTAIPDWRNAAREKSIVFVSDSEERRIEDEENIDQRVASLEKGLQTVVCDLDEIKKKFGATESLKNEALRQYKEKIAGIPEVKKVFYMISQEGIDFLTLFQSSNRLRILKRIIPLQVELDSTYKDVYFDFQVSHVSGVETEELADWTLLYEKLR